MTFYLPIDLISDEEGLSKSGCFHGRPVDKKLHSLESIDTCSANLPVISVSLVDHTTLGGRW